MSTANGATNDRTPTPDPAEDNAFFPSPYSLSQYVPARTDFDGVRHAGEYTGGRWKILMIGTEERYMMMRNGTFFSTGNHPVEMLLPLHHMHAAGFDVDIATLGGNPVKLELWAFPSDDPTIAETYEEFKPKLKKPLSLQDVAANLGEDSDYLAVFIPGGHGAMNDLPHSPVMQKVLDWALDDDRLIIALCHGPAALAASGLNRDASRFDGYSICVFPDALDRGANRDIGYIPGELEWYLGEALEKQGITILNQDMTGAVHRDRNLLTGDSPLASNQLGIVSAEALLEQAAKRDK